jgi:hypothetical protein
LNLGSTNRHHLATMFDRNYLNRGLALLDSLDKHGSSYLLHVLALDQYVEDFFEDKGLSTVQVTSLSALERWDSSLQEAKKNRSYIEFIFTLSPFFPLYLLEKNQDMVSVTSLDSDLCFFENIGPFLEGFDNGEDSIMITAHSFPESLRNRERFGLYNVSFQSFKNDHIGLSCLRDWAIKCREWCYDTEEDKEGRFADQKYLDDWKQVFKHVRINTLENGVGLAPWNICDHKIQRKRGKLMCDGVPVLFYHFHGLRIYNKHVVSHGVFNYSQKKLLRVVKRLYADYHGLLLSSIESGNDIQISRYQISDSSLFELILKTNGLLWRWGFLSLQFNIPRLKNMIKTWLK